MEKPQAASPLSGRPLAGPFCEVQLVLAEVAQANRGVCFVHWRSQSCLTATGKLEHRSISD